ncbi:hypothetical protein [Ferruginibacter profundus]
MLKLLFYCFTIALFSCRGNSADHSIAVQQKSPAIDTIIKPYRFDCFKSADTIRQIYARACADHFYKIIDSQYVLVLHLAAAVQYDSCFKIHIDTATGSTAELIIYPPGKATLFEYCNDYGNGIVPIKNIRGAVGDIYVKFYHPTEYRGTDKPTASIFVRTIIFTDTTNNATIKFENELYWKVAQWGPAG